MNYGKGRGKVWRGEVRVVFIELPGAQLPLVNYGMHRTGRHVKCSSALKHSSFMFTQFSEQIEPSV